MSQPAYQDASLSISERVGDLLGRMTLGEKVAQLSAVLGWPGYQRSSDGVAISDLGKDWLSGDGIGGLYGLLRADPWTGVTARTGLTAEEGARLVNQIQAYNREHTRLGIPVFVIAEANHGYMALGGTIGPSLLTASQAWNPDLWKRFMDGVREEIRAQGNSIAFCPNVDLSRDPRWGRTEETAGEDPHLASAYASAAVRGLQGEALGDTSIGACLKHFVHGVPDRGLNAGAARMGSQELHEVFLRPFRAGIAAGAAGVMPSYNEWDGEPCSGNPELLGDLLRVRLGFQCATFSDVGALGMLVSPFRRVEDHEHAAAMALEAGIDFETAQTRLYKEPLLRALGCGLVSEETVDRSVRRVLELKFRLGLFESTADPGAARDSLGCEAHRTVALQVAREGIVLLKNEGVLPLPKNLKRLAVIGPNADNVYNQLGDYTPPQRQVETITVLQGLRGLLPNTDVVCSKGCGIRDESNEGFAEALRVASDSDAIVLVLGGSSARDFSLDDLSTPEVGAMGVERTSSDIECGEGLDRSSLDLLGVQTELAKAIFELGKPLVVVLIGGRPMTVEWIRASVPAIVFSGYPGQLGGQAIAEVLFGDTNPSGRLTMTWPKSAGHLPLVYNAKPGLDNDYVDAHSGPAFCFGHGLSYSSFEYYDLKVEVTSPMAVRVGAWVRNTSETTGEEVVQLYLRDEVSSLTRPGRELKGFQRIHLDPGEERLISFELGPEELGFYDRDGKLRVEPGAFTIFVGGSLQATLSTKFHWSNV